MGEKEDLKCNYETVKDTKGPGIGMRHLQVMIMFLVVSVLYIIRSGMGVAVLAMTDKQLSVANTTNDSKSNFTAHVVTFDTGDTATLHSYSEKYDWDEKIRGMILSAFFWGYTINQVPGGIVAQKFGAKPVLFVSLIVNGLVCLGLPFIIKYGGWKTMIGMRWLTGLTQCVFPCCHTLLGKWTPPQERTTLGNIAYAGVQIGTIISMPLCGFLAQTAIGWKLIFYTMACLAFATAVLWYFLAANSPAQHRWISEKEKIYIEQSISTNDQKKSPSIPWKALGTSVPLAALLATHMGCSWMFTIFFTYIPSYMNNILGISVRDSGMLSALPFIAMWVFSTFASIISEFIYNRNILSLTTTRKLMNTIGNVLPTLGLLVLSYMTREHSYLAILVLSATVGCQGFTMSGFMMNHLDLSPNHAGIMLGITNALANLFSAMGPIVTGLILGTEVHNLSRWRMLFFITAGIVTVTNLVFVIWGTSKKQPWDDPDYKNDKYQLDDLKESDKKVEQVYMFEQKE